MCIRDSGQAAGARHDAPYELAYLQAVVTAQAAQGPGEAEDQNGGCLLYTSVFQEMAAANKALAK